MNKWGERWRFQDQPWEHLWLSSDSGPMRKGDKVRFIRKVVDGMTLLVDHPEQGEQRVAALAIELPREFKTARSHWIPESDPRVEVFLLKALDDVRSGGKKIQASADPLLRRNTEQEILRLLERNGWGERIAPWEPKPARGA
jgi:hypothetical protein